MLDGGEWRRAGPAVVPGHEHVIRVGLGHPGRHRTDARLRDELHPDPRRRVHLLEIVDQLREILDRVDVVVGRRRDQRDPHNRVPQPSDEVRHLVAGELAALARLGALRDFDLELGRAHQILRGDPEAA